MKAITIQAAAVSHRPAAAQSTTPAGWQPRYRWLRLNATLRSRSRAALAAHGNALLAATAAAGLAAAIGVAIGNDALLAMAAMAGLAAITPKIVAESFNLYKDEQR